MSTRATEDKKHKVRYRIQSAGEYSEWKIGTVFSDKNCAYVKVKNSKGGIDTVYFKDMEFI